jgi:hypothetical protein
LPRNGSSLFLKEEKKHFWNVLKKKVFIRGLAYLSNIFKTNEINLSAQGPEVTIMDAV